MRTPRVRTCDMGIGDALTELGSFLDDCEARGGTVQRVDFEAVTEAGAELLRAEVDLALSVDEYDVRVEPDAGTLEDGGAIVRFCAAVPASTDAVEATAPPVDSSAGVESLADGSATSEGPGEIRVSSPDSDGRAESEDGDSAAPARAGDSTSRREVPPFKDPDLLASVYDSCDTFAEMAAELEMDVTAETVRRYMIDYDIHEPDTYRTSGASAAAADDQVVLSDGIGLPDDVTAEDLVETVERSNTIYEVKQDIDIERDDALEMLQDLNLLDLVVGRLSTEGEREVTREDIVDRLREASAVQ